MSGPRRTRPQRSEDVPAPKGAGERTAGRRGVPWYVSLPVTLAVILALFLAMGNLGWLPGIPNPFGEKTVDRSQPAVLKSVQNMSRYNAATGDFQVIVDLANEAKFLPSAILGSRSLYVGSGSVEAYVDLGKLGADSVKVSEDRRTASVTIPHAQLAGAALDVERSYMYSHERGLFDRLGDLFSDSTAEDQHKVEMLAVEKIDKAAKDTELTATAETNTKAMLTGLLTSLGFTQVTVTVA
ncbi:DUF4230 domain-containing protein [Kitasatospora phosalacinea]|uniref:DUF4230 domain-containing protein n=1 Tax=Kitasatospora phosalacinea TaxID=2065 RepID=A0A9W6PIG2_9ACTN|nr:DUF4230 domain-containing protein [Kitasatospora phosalacinea]GLW55630.1 hypothetical protein Kpho01_36410 [Kitasatospora phosalacinea]